jgi:hypothetical protein
MREVQRPKSEVRRKAETRSPKLEAASPGFWNSGFFWSSDFGLWISFAFFLLPSLVLGAATNPISADEIPPLRPPRGELAPTFWEQHGVAVGSWGAVGLLILGVAIWYLLRARPAVPIAPEVQARRDLDSLRQQPETGAVLSRVSQVLRHYVAAAFHLPQGELTTSEFCSAIAHQEQVGAELSGAVSTFLRECDQRKFAPAPPAAPLGAVSQASKLVELAEARRAQLHQSTGEATTPSGPAPQAAPAGGVNG